MTFLYSRIEGGNFGRRTSKLCNLHKSRVRVLYNLAFCAKPEKLVKKCLTNENESAIICKLTTSGHKNGGGVKQKNIAKIFEKLFKNLLTNGNECAIITRSRKTRRAGPRFCQIIDN